METFWDALPAEAKTAIVAGLVLLAREAVAAWQGRRKAQAEETKIRVDAKTQEVQAEAEAEKTRAEAEQLRAQADSQEIDNGVRLANETWMLYGNYRKQAVEHEQKLNEKIDALERRIAGLESVSRENEQMKRDLQTLHEENTQLKRENVKLQKKNTELEQELANVQTKLREMQAEIAKLKKKTVSFEPDHNV